jgi:hypothetical protein
MLRRLLTRNLTQVPLLWVTFNYQLFKKNGKKNSCMLNIHPTLKDDVILKKKLYEIVDYIRDNYDMKELL